LTEEKKHTKQIIGPKLPKIKEKLFYPRITQIKQINFWNIFDNF